MPRQNNELNLQQEWRTTLICYLPRKTERKISKRKKNIKEKSKFVGKLAFYFAAKLYNGNLIVFYNGDLIVFIIFFMSSSSLFTAESIEFLNTTNF